MENNILEEIDIISKKYSFRPLPKLIKEKYHKLYLSNLNGFEKKRNLNINGISFSKSYERVVIGDYGSYVEINPKDLLVELSVTKGQEWRLDKDFLKKRNLSIKYEWYEYQGKKVYLQLNTVLYADYKPGFYYISVLYFDKIEEEIMIMKNEYKWLSNMCLFPKPIIVNGELIKSSEHYYHSRKTLDPELRKIILNMDNPYEVKKFCKSIKLRDDWKEVKIPTMIDASNIKYNIPFFRLKLLACQEPFIEENYHRDTFWGTYNGVGENHLGIILTNLRQRIIKEEIFKKDRILYGDLYTSNMDYKCFTSNSTLDKNNHLVMGKGNALIVKKLYPILPEYFGETTENMGIYGLKYEPKLKIMAFQTKTDWKKESTIGIIKNSLSLLNKFAKDNNTYTIGLPFPGVNNGKLNEKDVLPLLLDLPDNVFIWKEKPNKFFTGIGSRETPKEIGIILKEFTDYMTSRGYVLRSGGAPGADLDCESGVNNNLKEIYIPWKGFNSSDSDLYIKEDSEETIKIASENHPAYEYLKPAVKKLMNRNVYQVLGDDLNTPSEFVICYTRDGCKSHLSRSNKTGGTGLAISVASKNNIPIINLGNVKDLKMIKDLLLIK